MRPDERWRKLDWRDSLWDLVRFYRSLRFGAPKRWLQRLLQDGSFALREGGERFSVERPLVELLRDYLEASARDLDHAFASFRTEEQALKYCTSIGVTVGKTTTKNLEHHQSSKAMIAAVSTIATKVCGSAGCEVNINPQRRSVWCSKKGLHVSARNLDGAVPSLLNPAIVWEIKEYWGTTGGGSKMSDAVYECNLVGRELREFEERVAQTVAHVVFLDGKGQWESRRSDVGRFIDLFHQGLIDHLILGSEVETVWEALLGSLLSRPHPLLDS